MWTIPARSRLSVICSIRKTNREAILAAHAEQLDAAKVEAEKPPEGLFTLQIFQGGKLFYSGEAIDNAAAIQDATAVTGGK